MVVANFDEIRSDYVEESIMAGGGEIVERACKLVVHVGRETEGRVVKSHGHFFATGVAVDALQVSEFILRDAYPMEDRESER